MFIVYKIKQYAKVYFRTMQMGPVLTFNVGDAKKFDTQQEAQKCADEIGGGVEEINAVNTKYDAAHILGAKL